MLALLRWILVWIWFMLSTSILSIILLFRPKNPKNAYLVTRTVCGPAMKILGIRLHIDGEEKLYQNQPCVYIANHQATLDIFVFGSFFPTDTFVVGKKSLRYLPFFGWAYGLSGNAYIDRKNKDNAMAQLAHAEQLITEKGKSFFLFPEGTRSRGKGLGKFKKGAFHVALHTNTPVVGIVCENYQLNLNKLNPGTLNIKVLDPMQIKSESEIASVVQKAEEDFKKFQSQFV